MLSVVVLGKNMDSKTRQVHRVEPGQSVGELAETYRHPLWQPQQEPKLFVGGKEVQATYVPQAGDIVTIAPSMGAGTVAIALAVITVLGTMYGYWRARQQAAIAKRAEELRKHRPYGFDTPSLTTYGEGFRIPFGYGEYRTGGAVIGSRLEQSTLFRLGTELNLLLVLGEGPIESIGGLTMEPRGEADYLTGATYFSGGGLPDPRFPYNTWQFPAGMLINGLQADAKSVSVCLRKGTLVQSPIPDWPGAEVSVSVGGSNLITVGSSTSYTTTEADVWSVTAELFFPEGLWFEGSSGAVLRRFVDFEIAYRVGTGTWQTRNVRYEASPPVLAPFSYFVDARVFPPGGGPFEIRVTRLVEDGNAQGGRVHSTFSLRSVQVRYGAGFEYSFSYPGLALIAVRLPATEQTNGALNNISVPIRARKVRGWVNDAVGWTAETWGPTGPWAFPLSSNPAWAFVDVCLNKRYGLGNIITEDDLDLPSFRNWADLCDQGHPLDVDEPLLRWDGQIDAGEDAVEVLVRIAAAGRAIPVLSGGRKLSVKMSYRDGFERGTGATLNQVPARAPVGVITTSSVTSFEATYNDPATAPVVIDAQILDRQSDYELRTISSEDRLAIGVSNGTAPLRIAPRREIVQMLGVVRRLQARYEIQLMHNMNRLSRVMLKVRMPIEAIPYEIGDIVIVQNDALLSGGNSTQSARTTNAGTVSDLHLSKPVTVTGTTPRTDFGVWLTDDGGVVREFTVDLDGPGPITIQAGDDLPLWDPVGLAPGSVDVQRATPVAFGPYTTTRRLFEVVGISTTQEMLREMELAEWSEEMYDMPEFFDETNGLGDDDPPPVDELVSNIAVEVQGTMTAGGEMRMESSVRWSPAVQPGLSRMARVYAKGRDGRWALLGETADDHLDNMHLHTGAEYVIAVCRADGLGRFPGPGQVATTTISVPEFGPATPQQVERLVAHVDLQRITLEWPHVDDAIGYEIRRGEEWYGSEVIAVTQHNTHTIVAPPAGSATYRIKARSNGGLYSETDTTVVAAWAPLTTVATATHLTTTVAGGTAVSVEWDGTAEAATIEEGEHRGTWTAPELDVGADTVLYWSALANVWAVDGGTLGPFTLGQPERFFEVAGGRQATRLYPGFDFDTGPASDPVNGYADPEMEATTLGDWVRVQIETRFFADGAWGAWEKHVPGLRLAQKMEARVVLDRYALDIDPFVNSFVLTAGF